MAAIPVYVSGGDEGGGTPGVQEGDKVLLCEQIW